MCWTAAFAALAASLSSAPLPVEILRATGSLPARLVENIESPRAFVETSTGVALVLDSGAQAIYAINAARSASRRVVQVGTEPGHLMSPSGFSLGPNDVLAVTDQPGAYARVQYFSADGRLISLFWRTPQPGVRMTLGRLTLGGPGAMAFTGRTVLINAPDTGALINEYGTAGEPLRSIGRLRPTAQEADAAVHAMLNTGLPLVDPTGGYYFVFDTGVPLIRKYDAAGELVFERHVEGPELDARLRAMPASWPARSAGGMPYGAGLIQAAAVDPAGRLWVSITPGYTYVYDRQGDKIRTVQFEASGPIAPTSLFFARGNRLLITPGCYEFPVK
jgi:hypothetical protein